MEIVRTNQLDEYDPVVSDNEVLAAPAKMAAQGENFAGTARKAAKLSTPTAAVEPFADVKALIDTLPAESTMTGHHPPISTAATSNRVTEEKRNVQLEAWVYAASREADNDFHLIVGRDPNASTPMYMTMEVSGLPPHSATAFAAIQAARNAFKAAVQQNTPGTGYDFYKPPIHIEIGGALFFDMTHATGGRPGPADLRDDMPVIWEVHPVTHFVVKS
jgi:hypothetical protein